MERVELLVVERTWEARPGMLVLRPNLPVPRALALKEEDLVAVERTESVVVARPDGQELLATAEIRITHVHISDPDAPIEERWRITIWLTDRTAAEVPAGSKLLVARETREAILPAST